MLRLASILFLFFSTIDLHSQPMDAELLKTFKIQEEGIFYFKKGNPDKALPLLLESKRRLENKLGNKHLAVAAAYYILGGAYSDLEKDNEALIYNEKALAIYEKTDHQYTENLLASISGSYQRLGEHKKAIPALEKLAAIKKAKFGYTSNDHGIALNSIANSYQSLGEHGKAAAIREDVLKIVLKIFNKDSPNVITTYLNLSLDYMNAGENEKALPFTHQALEIIEKNKGKEHPDTASTLNDLASLYQATGDYETALTLFDRAIAIYEKVLGPEHPNTAASLNNLAFLYCAIGDYTKAVRTYEIALAILEKVLGAEHPNTASILNNLAFAYKSMGNYTKALPIYQSALAIREKSPGPDSLETAQSLNNLASIYQDIGDYAKALSIYELGLAIFEKTLGPDHPDTAASLNNMAFLYSTIGDYAKALPLYERALAITEKARGPDHPATAMSLNNLASVYNSIGDYTKARPLLERTLAINEKSLGPEHPNTAASLNNLAFLFSSMAEYEKSLPLYERALAIREKNLGPEHPDTAESLNNLASFYFSIGDYDKTLRLSERALAIREKSLGSEHPDTAQSLSDLAILKYRKGEISKARAYAERHITAKQSELQTILTQDEGTRLSWQHVNQSFWLACLLEPGAIADLVLRMKGIVLDSLVEDRSIALAAQSSSEGAESLKKISQLQARLSKLAFEPGQDDEVTRLKGEISQLQRDMAAKYLGRNLQRASATITQADITTKLNEGSALIDLFQFPDPKLKGGEAECLGAILMAPNNKLEFVRIDGAKAIRQAIESLRQGIANGDAACVKEETEFLSEKLWRPIAQKIPEGTNRLVISPDGDLNFLSFAALLGEDGKFLVENYDISYVGNARDLLRESNPNPPNRIRIFGNPIFDQATEPVEENRFAFRSMEVDVFGQIQLPLLPGTEKECAEIQKIAANSGWDLETFTRDRADEKNIRGTSKPGILHLATHGFYLNSYTPPADNTRGMSVIGIEAPQTNKKGVDPMRASGIALTGAQSTLRSWAERKAPDPENDGILTAEEVAALDLQGTWLVSLSACETGVGEARSGEGVLGLRRSFMMAGAENLLMTLWPVSDQTTSEIMADFYREALKTGNAPSSLAKVQRAWLVKLRKEKGLLEAVRDAGPFVMATIGKPLPPLPREPSKQESLLDKVGRKIEALIQSSKTDIKNN